MLATTLSALYGKLLVVMGIAFPMAEVISTYIPPSFYEVKVIFIYGTHTTKNLLTIVIYISGFLFILILRKYAIFIFYVRNHNLGSAEDC